MQHSHSMKATSNDDLWIKFMKFSVCTMQPKNQLVVWSCKFCAFSEVGSGNLCKTSKMA